MAKKPTLLTVGTGYNSSTAINTSLQRLRDSFDNTLSLDGSGPNAMEADLDMNSNDILNAGVVDVGSLRINGQSVAVSDTFEGLETDVKYNYKSVALLLSDTRNYTFFATGDYVLAGEFRYEVTASGATDHHVATAGGVKLYALPTNGIVTPNQFGAVGDGVADDTDAIQKSFDLAADGYSVAFPAGYTFLHSDLLIVRNGVKGLYGFGGIIKADNATCGILLAGIESAEGVNVTNCDIIGLKIDGGGYAINAIHGQNVQNCKVIGNHIYNVVDGYGILFRSYLSGGRNTVLVNISDNVVILNANSYGADKHGIAIDILDAELNFSPSADAVAYWKANFTAALPTYYADRCSVTNNIVVGGYYGVSAQGAQNCNIESNVLQQNTRGISAQHGAIYNTIQGNRIINCASSAVHLAFGSRFNLIEGNRITNAANGGEALLQAYLGCSDNTFIGNHVFTGGTSGNQFFIYIGPKCDRCHVIANTLVGPVERTGICAESEWNPSDPEQYGYANGKTIPDPMTDAGLSAVVIKDNVITLSFVRPAIMLSAVTRGSNRHVTGCDVSGNVVIGTTPYRQFQINEYSGSQVQTLSLVGNKFADGATPTEFVLPRGGLHFSQRANNAVLDNGPHQFVNGDTSPDVSFGNGFFFCVNGGATSITTFDNAAPDQQITVKLDNNTTLVHNSAVMRLNGGVNLVGSSSDEIVTLRKFSGIWFEVSRNF